MNDQRTRAVLEGRARDMILKVHKYFEEEKEQCKLLLKRLTTLTHDMKEVRVPFVIFTDLVNYLKSTFQVSKRVVAATCINKNSLTKIKEEGAAAKTNNTGLLTPKRKPRGKKKYFNEDEYHLLENIIQTNFKNKKQDFKFKTLLSVVRRELNYTGSLATLRRIMLDMGFRWAKKPGSAYVTFLENDCSNNYVDNIGFSPRSYHSNRLNICCTSLLVTMERATASKYRENTNVEDCSEENNKSTVEYEEYLDEEVLEASEENEECNKNMELNDEIEILEEYQQTLQMPKDDNIWNSNEIITNVHNTLNIEMIGESPQEIYLLHETCDWENCNVLPAGQSRSEENTSSFAIMQYLKLDSSEHFQEQDLDEDEVYSNIENQAIL